MTCYLTYKQLGAKFDAPVDFLKSISSKRERKPDFV